MAGEQPPSPEDMGIDPNTGAATPPTSSVEFAKQDRKTHYVDVDGPKYGREIMSPMKYATATAGIWESVQRIFEDRLTGKPPAETPPPSWKEQAKQLLDTLTQADSLVADMTSPLVSPDTPAPDWAAKRGDLIQAAADQMYTALADRPTMYATKYGKHRPLSFKPLGQLGQDTQPGPGEPPSSPTPTPGPESGGGESSWAGGKSHGDGL